MNQSNGKYKVASMFAGIGGICLGFKQAGADVIWANEVDQKACTTYTNYFGDSYLDQRDIRDVSEKDVPKEIDILTAGWPCVAFSVAGRRYGMNYKCERCNYEHTVTYEEYVNGVSCPECGGKTEPKDPRGTLFYDVIRILRETNPRAFLLENVKNLKGHDNGRTYKNIVAMLEESGYFVKEKILNTMGYANIPQNRERIIIVGFKKEYTQETKDENIIKNFDFPKPVKLSKTLDDIVNRHEKKDDRFYYTESSPYFEMLNSTITRKDTIYQLRRVYVRENQSNVCPTLTANMGTGGHNVPLLLDDYGIRKLTPEECLKFQGFPDDFKKPEGMALSHVYKQAGNSVTVPLIKRVAENIIKVLDGEKIEPGTELHEEKNGQLVGLI